MNSPSPGATGWSPGSPFDRLLIAWAMIEGLPIVGVDRAFDPDPVRGPW